SPSGSGVDHCGHPAFRSAAGPAPVAPARLVEVIKTGRPAGRFRCGERLHTGGAHIGPRQAARDHHSQNIGRVYSPWIVTNPPLVCRLLLFGETGRCRAKRHRHFDPRGSGAKLCDWKKRCSVVRKSFGRGLKKTATGAGTSRGTCKKAQPSKSTGISGIWPPFRTSSGNCENR